MSDWPTLADLDVFQIDPRRIKLLDVNAHFMRHETFARLTGNVKGDSALTSVPFGWHYHDDETRTPQSMEDGSPLWEVLSGNHRVEAAIAADVSSIWFMATRQYLPPDRRMAIQLSHNAIFGEDDPQLLKTLYQKINNVGMRLYSGLDDKMLGLLGNVDISPLSEEKLVFQTISLTFLPDEIQQVQSVWEQVRKQSAGAKGHWLARWQEYDKTLDALDDAGLAYGVRNIATALKLVLEIFERHRSELGDGYMDGEGEPVERTRRVAVSTIFDDDEVSAALAVKLRRAISKLNKGVGWDALETWADEILKK